MKYFLMFIPLALFLTACGEHDSSSAQTTPPAAPSAPTIDGAPMVETLRPVLHGACEKDTAISLYADGQKVAASSTCTDGAYSIRPDAPLTHGSHCFSVQATDVSGVASDRSKATCAFTGRPFITVWKTDNQGITEGNQIRITPDTANYTYNYSIDWGDGTSEMNLTTGDVVHTYPSAGVYTVKINGVFPYFEVHYDDNDYGDSGTYGNYSDKWKLIGVSQWGSMPWQSMNGSFNYCMNTDFNATDIPDLSQTTSLEWTFVDTTSKPGNIGEWNTSNIAVIDRTFAHLWMRESILDIDISDWNISSLENAEYMFSGTTLPTVSYDKLLNSWSKQPVKHDVHFSAGNSHYSPSAAAARSVLTDQYGWTIYDGGLVK